MNNITLRQLRALLAIQSEGKIVSAARLLGLTAPAVTLQLKQLEEEVGMTLFDRTSQGMRATDAGEAFIIASKDVFARLDLLDEELNAIRGVRRGTLRVGVVSMAEYLAPQMTEAFQQECPDIDVSFVVGNRNETMTRLKNYEVDIVLTARPPRDISVRAVPFAEYRLIIVAAPNHPLAKCKNISRSDIAEEYFIVREQGSGPRVSVERFLTNVKQGETFHYTEMLSNDEIKKAVMADLGIGFVATHTVSAEIESGELIVLDVETLPIRRQWFAITRSDRSLTPLILSFQEFLTKHGAHFLHPNDIIFGHD